MQVIKKVSDNQGDTWNALITLDVQNAFNTANWELILQKLEESKISDYLINVISNYLHERTIQIKSGEIIEVNAGVRYGIFYTMRSSNLGCKEEQKLSLLPMI